MERRFGELNPPQRLLMGPGPSNVDPRILRAMATPVIGHLDPAFLSIMDETMGWLREVYETRNHHTVPISATGSAGVEAMMVNLLEPGDDVVVGIIGYFGQRMADVASRTGANVRVIEAPLGEAIPPERFEEELRRKPAKLVALVHAETSTGAEQEIAPVAEIAHRYGALIAIDCVTSLGGMPVRVDEWGVDAAASCSQKCLGAPPGLSPVTFSPRAMEVITGRKSKCQSWYLDVNLLFAYWGDGKANNRVFHHTGPITMIYAMREALRIALEEGLEARYARHRKAHEAFAAGLEAMGLTLFTKGKRLPMLNVINIPEGIDDLAVRRRLLEQNIEISGGFGPLAGRVWRVGLMGVNANPAPVITLLGALEQALVEQGYRCERGAAVAAARAVYKQST
ncbi:pyridoxal-phosphate-dependent aminotransferase family protein [Symbiobacterium thermophilum]|mgnify:CR=1 FL=1|uniref:Class-V aminotransferase n=2 Tax=Symbiobacterium thermophilum TaxID=2734 RepID=Q67JJ0_SYMTH|nr:alanine--glyoxylate aminotransferase family protein [Symbiobacterium thermophilum]BAD42160.1 class-V aminotransferase [Symbiobacterium thermophilum IAM 14863]